MSVDFSKHPIYFFDDDDHNYDEKLVEKRESLAQNRIPPIKFVPIEGGHEILLPAGVFEEVAVPAFRYYKCLLYTSPSPRDGLLSRMTSSA